MKFIKRIVAKPELEDLTLTPELNRFHTGKALSEYFARERTLIDARRKSVSLANKQQNYVGLAFSGGGIRSATFGLGVLEAFESPGVNVMRHVDYLSTVSGGGFLGGAYSAWRYRQVTCSETGAGAECPKTTKHPPASVRELVPHLRKFGRYLAPRLGLMDAEPWRIVGTFVRNIVIHWVVLVSAMFALFALLLLGFRHLYATSFLALSLGLGLIGAGMFKEWQARRCLARRARDPALSCDPAQELLQAPRLGLFIGLALCALGAALSFVTTTRLKFPELEPLTAYFSWWSAVADQLTAAWSAISQALAFAHNLSPVFAEAARAPGFATAVMLLCLTVVVISLIVSVSNWRWRQRAIYVPSMRWIGLPLVATLYFLAWYGLANSEGAFAARNWETTTPLSFRELLGFYTAQDLVGAWGWVWKTGVVVLAFSALFSVLIAAFNAWMDREEREWFTRLVSITLMVASGWLLVGGLVVFGAWLATTVYLTGLIPGQDLLTRLAGALGVAGAGAWIGLSTWAAKVASSETIKSLTTKYWKQLLVQLGPPVFLVGLILLCGFAAASLVIRLSGLPEGIAPAALWGGDTVWWLLGGSVTVLAIFGRLLDPNEFSLHGFYRDRIVRSYLGASNNDSPAPDSVWNIRSDDIPLSCLKTSVRKGAPFHIVNTAVNLFGSKDLQVQQRSCDSFVLTPTGCGSWATNYAEIPPRLYLGSAVAASGAAVSSGMGMATHGAAVAALMTVFNVRLGFWFGNPRFSGQRRKRPLFPPALLLAEALSSTNESRSFVNLSDGGHFDNLGLYELLRRRCKYIIVVDAECDENYGFGSLEQVVRFARVDFGVRININFRQIAPPKSADGQRYANSHWALGTIDYRDCQLDKGCDRGLSPFGENEAGQLLYIKSSLLEPGKDAYITPDVVGYAQRHPGFPHESTADQFFSEAQFESYRHLGRAIGEGLVAGWDGQSIATLFEKLKKSPKTAKVAKPGKASKQRR
ncbi:MAG TPA: patatin-like phospholipase family protein [Acidiferrobacterales bacterium]|nr:patatin-like phospholipase family protein [Acidiferrobacterales bacterium]